MSEDEVIKKAKKHFNLSLDAYEDELQKAADDMVFAFSEDGQWDSYAIERRHGKPRYTLNQVEPAINEIIGNYRQNKIEMKARALNDSSAGEVNTLNGLLKAIISQGESEDAKDIAFKSIATCGYGAIKVINEYSESNPFYQDVCVKQIPDAINCTRFDPAAERMDASDGAYCFQLYKLSTQEFKDKYPEFKPVSFDSGTTLLTNWGNYSSSSDMTIVDYYVKERAKTKLILLSDDSTMIESDYIDVVDELNEQGVNAVDAKDHEVTKVMCYRLSGADLLEEPTELPTSQLPLVRVLGFHEWHDGCLHFRGIVRQAKDAQRILNYAFSADIEQSALAPKGKVLATPKMLQGFKDQWGRINDTRSSVVMYNPDSESVGTGGKPEPFNVAQPNASLQVQAQSAQLFLQSVMGRRSPAIGESARDRSGRAILALQRQDDAVTFELLDNLSKAVEQCARIAIEMIPVVYDTRRQVEILKDDGETEIITINDFITDNETGEDKRRFNLNTKYSVKASVGPAYETRRSEMVNVLSTLTQDPQLKPLVADLFAKSLDFPFSDELTARIRKAQLAQGVVSPNEEEAQQIAAQSQTPEAQQAVQVQQAIQQLQLQQLQLQNQEAQARIANLVANVNNLTASANKKVQEGSYENARVESERTDAYTQLVDTVVKKIEAGMQATPQELQVLEQSLSLLDASQREEYLQRIRANLGALQNARQ